MRGNKYILEHDRFAAGARQPLRVPVVLDDKILLRYQHEAVVGRTFLIRNETLQIFPIDEVDAAGEAPDAVEHQAAFDIAALAALGRKR